MKKLPVALAAALALAIPTIAPPTASAAPSCTSGKYASNRAFYSYCTGVLSHHANAQMYFDSGYSSWKNSPAKPSGFRSESGIYPTAYVMNGPFVVTIV